MTQLLDAALIRVRNIFDPLIGAGRQEQLPPDDGTVDPLISFFRCRGWTILDRDSDTSASVYYPGSFHGALDDEHRRQATPDLGLSELECVLALRGEHWIAHFTSCGTLTGCVRHRSTSVLIGVHSAVFPAVIRELERHARTLDRDLSRCLIFGPCGSSDNPDEPCRLSPPAPEAPASLHAVAERDESVK